VEREARENTVSQLVKVRPDQIRAEWSCLATSLLLFLDAQGRGWRSVRRNGWAQSGFRYVEAGVEAHAMPDGLGEGVVTIFVCELRL
jgi:hypothetical protein